MALSIVIQRLVSRASLILASLDKHLDTAVTNVSQELTPYLRAGEQLDTRQMQLFFTLMARCYQDKRENLEQADTHYNDEQADDVLVRESSAELTERVYLTLQSLRDNLSSHYNRSFLNTLQLTGRLPRTISAQKALLHFLVGWFGNGSNALPANSNNLFATRPDKGQILSILQPLHDEVDTLEKALSRETRETQIAQLAKNTATQEFHTVESAVLDLSLGLYEWAGLKEMADRLVPPLQRRRHHSSTRVSSEPAVETPPSPVETIS